jgi:hypothetical protein
MHQLASSEVLDRLGLVAGMFDELGIAERGVVLSSPPSNSTTTTLFGLLPLSQATRADQGVADGHDRLLPGCDLPWSIASERRSRTLR